MRYAITFTQDGTWETADTLILETDTPVMEMDRAKLAQVFANYLGDDENKYELALDHDKWFVRNLDDTDVTYVNQDEKMYELTLILRAGADVYGFIEDIKTYIRDGAGGTVTKCDDNGIKTLPYKIFNEYRGQYFYMDVEGLDEDGKRKLIEKLQNSEEVLRFLCIKKDMRRH